MALSTQMTEEKQSQPLRRADSAPSPGSEQPPGPSPLGGTGRRGGGTPGPRVAGSESSAPGLHRKTRRGEPGEGGAGGNGTRRLPSPRRYRLGSGRREVIDGGRARVCRAEGRGAAEASRRARAVRSARAPARAADAADRKSVV